jgi:predicted NBD/HSP70 family sugar kinase
MSQRHPLTAGIDLGDRYTHVCLLDSENGEVIEESRIPTNQKAFQRRFSGIASMRIARSRPAPTRPG